MYNDISFYIANGYPLYYSPYSESPVQYNIGNSDYIIDVKGQRTTITPAQIAEAAVNAGLTVTNNIISYTSYAIVFDVNTCDIKILKDPFTATNVKILTSSAIIFLAHYKSIRKGLAVEYMQEKRIESAENSVTSLISNMTEVRGSIDTLESEIGTASIPSYFEDNLNTKIPIIINNMNNTGQDGTNFVFITDIHWETNYKNSPTLMKYVLDKTSIKNVFCGGDIINEGEKDLMYATFLDCINHYRFIANNGFFPITRGNHDDNSNWSSAEDITKYAFDQNTMYNLLYLQIAEKTTRISAPYWSFYYDQPNIKTRYIFADTRRNGLIIDYSAIKQCLDQVQSEWHVIFIMHFTLKNATTLFDGCDLLAHLVYAYNNRESVSYEGTYQTINYDFTSAAGYVDLIIGGHTHADYAMSATDPNNPSGITIIATDTDSYRNHAGTEGTINSQCFDVVTVNYIAKTVKCVRIGRGSDREFTY